MFLINSLLLLLVSCVFASPFYYNYGVTNIHDNHIQCVLLSDEQIQKQFRIYTVTLYYFIPLTIIIISYTKLLYYIYSKENKLRTNTVMIKVFFFFFLTVEVFFFRNILLSDDQENVEL